MHDSGLLLIGLKEITRLRTAMLARMFPNKLIFKYFDDTSILTHHV